MTDPLGDMLTRIRNGRCVTSQGFHAGLAPARQRVLDVLQDEGYIRGYSTTRFGNGRTEFEIELKYFRANW